MFDTAFPAYGPVLGLGPGGSPVPLQQRGGDKSKGGQTHKPQKPVEEQRRAVPGPGSIGGGIGVLVHKEGLRGFYAVTLGIYGQGQLQAAAVLAVAHGHLQVVDSGVIGAVAAFAFELAEGIAIDARFVKDYGGKPEVAGACDGMGAAAAAAAGGHGRALIVSLEHQGIGLRGIGAVALCAELHRQGQADGIGGKGRSGKGSQKENKQDKSKKPV